MKKELITNMQGICMMSMFIVGSSVVLGTGGDAKQDVWIALAISLALSLPMAFVYANLLTAFPGMDLYDLLHKVFGKIGGKIISMLFIWYSLHLGALVMRNFSEFVQIVSLPETPQYATTICFTLLGIWVVKSGIKVLGHVAAFTFPIVIFFVLLTLVLPIAKMDFINLKPVLYNGFHPVLASAFSLFSFPFAETIIFTMVFNKLKLKNNTFSVFLVSILIGGSVLLLSALRNILVLGTNTASSLYFPSYFAARTMNIEDFIQRFEILIAANYVLTGFVKISVCLYAASNGVARILDIKNYRHLVAPVGLLMMNLSLLIYTNALEMFDWAFKVYPYYAVPFQIILPVIILIGAKIKLRTTNHNEAGSL